MHDESTEIRPGFYRELSLGGLSDWQDIIVGTTDRRAVGDQRPAATHFYKLTIASTATLESGLPVRVSALNQGDVSSPDDRTPDKWRAVDQGVHHLLGGFAVGSMAEEIDGQGRLVRGEIRIGDRLCFAIGSEAIRALAAETIIAIVVEGTVLAAA